MAIGVPFFLNPKLETFLVKLCKIKMHIQQEGKLWQVAWEK